MSLEKYKNDKRIEFFFHKKIERIKKMIVDSVNLKNRLIEVNYRVCLVLNNIPNVPFEKAVRRNAKHIDKLNSLIGRLTNDVKNAYNKDFSDINNFDEQVKMMIEFGMLNLN